MYNDDLMEMTSETVSKMRLYWRELSHYLKMTSALYTSKFESLANFLQYMPLMISAQHCICYGSMCTNCRRLITTQHINWRLLRILTNN